jgi:cytochrome c553
MDLAALPGTLPASGVVFGASTVQAVGTVLAVLALVGFVIYVVVNVRAGRAEAGSEIELAPNRKPYYDDDALETTKLNRTLASGVILLAVIAVGLPLYWLNEPGRQSGAVEGAQRTFVARGLAQYEEESQCVNCHAAEGAGGQAPFTILNADNQFVAQVNWMAPALNTVLLRYSREEVAQIIELGRPGTPMAAWGAAGGGPRSEQEIDNIVDYLESIQLTSGEAQRESQQQLAVELGLLEESETDEAAVDAAIEQIDYQDLAVGEALFNLGGESSFAGGAYACGRCHTRGFSIITEGEEAVQPVGADISPYVDYQDGSGGLAPPLDELVPRKFATADELAEFVATGSVDGEGYGTVGQGSGLMPGFGDNPNTEAAEGDGMMTAEMVCAITRYAQTLRGGEQPADPATATTTTAPTTTTTAPGDQAQAEGEGEEEEQAAAEPGYCEVAAEEGGESGAGAAGGGAGGGAEGQGGGGETGGDEGGEAAEGQ